MRLAQAYKLLAIASGGVVWMVTGSEHPVDAGNGFGVRIGAELHHFITVQQMATTNLLFIQLKSRMAA